MDEIKSKQKLSHNENPWGDELNKFSYSETDQHNEADSDDQLISDETTMQEIDELLFIPPKKQCLSSNHNEPCLQVTYVTQDVNSMTQGTYTTTKTHDPMYATSLNETTNSNSNEAEDKLQNIICNMECVLRQSQDCLKVVQQQKEVIKQELLQKNSCFSIQTEMLQKVHVLLDGLQPEQRNKAERKILQFLCECQIKILNNEEINDVTPVNIY